MSLLALSPELILLVASNLRQVQILNVSLVCKHLNAVLELELYREYNKPRVYTRSLLPFIRKLIERPKLAKYVKRIDLHPWASLDLFQPEINNKRDVSEIEELREQELSEQDYHLLTQAAQESGVISTIDAYEPTSRLIDVAETLSPANEDINEFYPWYEHFSTTNSASTKSPTTASSVSSSALAWKTPRSFFFSHYFPTFGTFSYEADRSMSILWNGERNINLHPCAKSPCAGPKATCHGPSVSSTQYWPQHRIWKPYTHVPVAPGTATSTIGTASVECDSFDFTA
jgi:hypothetical protein